MSFLFTLLQSAALLFISPTVPGNIDKTFWTSISGWEREGALLVFKATSSEAVRECTKNPDHFIVAPILSQGGHRFYLDGKLVFENGDKTQKYASLLYNRAIVPCSIFSSGNELQWEAFTATHSLAHLTNLPRIVPTPSRLVLLETVGYVVVSGTLLVLGVVFYIILSGKISSRILHSLVLSFLLYGFSSALYCPDWLMIKMNPLLLQKLSDATVWAGIIFTARLFNALGFASNFTYRLVLWFCSFGIAIICLSQTLDQDQVGSNIAFLAANLFFFTTLYKVFSLFYKRKYQPLVLLSVLCFCLSGIHDTLLFQGLISSEPLFNVGVLTGTILLALIVNEQINATYRERDYLRQNLETEVKEKTKELQLKTTDLEGTLNQLKKAQADLIQSEKLASLGTLSAGIAHEINNAAFSVSISLTPSQKIISNLEEGEKKEKLLKLTKVMREGLDTIVAIVESLRSYTGSSKDNHIDVDLEKVIKSVINLTKSKFDENIKLELHLDSDLKVVGNPVGLHQIFTNLITNAVDAMPKGGSLIISAATKGRMSEILVRDTGIGIPTSIIDRIFDPFFTTKEIGKGTGLGLHIVRGEIEKHKGSISLQSIEGQGTEFRIMLPCVQDSENI